MVKDVIPNFLAYFTLGVCSVLPTGMEMLGVVCLGSKVFPTATILPSYLLTS